MNAQGPTNSQTIVGTVGEDNDSVETNQDDGKPGSDPVVAVDHGKPGGDHTVAVETSIGENGAVQVDNVTEIVPEGEVAGPSVDTPDEVSEADIVEGRLPALTGPVSEVPEEFVAAMFNRLHQISQDGISEEEAERILRALDGPVDTVVGPVENFAQYEAFVERGVILDEDTVRERLLLCGVGLAGEVGEVVDHLKKYAFHNRPVPRDAVVLELGDVLWYYTLTLRTLGITWDEVVARNVEKLKNRYPEVHNV